MEMMLVSISYEDPLWIAIAFAFGLIFKSVKLPPMLGFLSAGFVLNVMGAESDAFLQTIADLGVTLLLFTIGLKLRIGSLLKPEIWASTTIHMGATVVFTGALILALGAGGILMFDGVDLITALMIAFALSFSSTVFAVKTFEERGAMASRYGQIAIGVLIVQDIAAVVFLAFSSGKIPTMYAFALLLLIPGRYLLGYLLRHAGHSELLTVYGFILALGGAAVFEMVGMKGDLGALIIGVLLASQPKASELAGKLMGFKDVFLVCFFLTIGLTGLPSLEILGTSLILLLLIPLKVALFFWLFTRFRVRARGATMASLGLANFSEFGLIVAAIAISSGWLQQEWMTAIAVALSISFIIASPFNVFANNVYIKYRDTLKRFEGEKRLTGDENITVRDKNVLIFGMGRVGRSAYDEMQEHFEGRILGIDQDEDEVLHHIEKGRNVVRGDATNPEFWSRLDQSEADIQLILLAMPINSANRQAAEQLRERGYAGAIVATSKHFDEEKNLKDNGVDAVFNIYAEAGQGAASSMRAFIQTGKRIDDVSAGS